MAVTLAGPLLLIVVLSLVVAAGLFLGGAISGRIKILLLGLVGGVFIFLAVGVVVSLFFVASRTQVASSHQPVEINIGASVHRSPEVDADRASGSSDRAKHDPLAGAPLPSPVDVATDDSAADEKQAKDDTSSEKKSEPDKPSDETASEPNRASNNDADVTAKPALTPGPSPKVGEGSSTSSADDAETSADVERPAWVEAEPKRVGDVYLVSISAGPYTTRLECDRMLPQAVRTAVDEYVETYLGPEAVGQIRLSHEALDDLVHEKWEETLQTTLTPTTRFPMKRLHALLQFDRAFNDRLKVAWREAVVNRRLWYAGGGLTAVLALLAAAFGYLKIDEARGKTP